MNCSMEECITSILIIAFGTGVATDYISLPASLVGNPITTVVLVLFAVGAFLKFPVLGIALFLLIAIVLFKRNTAVARAVATYGVESIRQQPHDDAQPKSEDQLAQRQYDQFQETDSHNPMHAPVQEGFEPAPYGDAYLGETVEGAFPIGEARQAVSSDSSVYPYHPASDSGSNSFERFGPEMDEKKKSFSY